MSFPEPLDHGLLLRAVGVEEAGGEPLDGAIEIGAEETEWRFTPAAPWQPGRYHLVALAFLEDLAGNRIGAPFEIDVFRTPPENHSQDTYRIAFAIGR